MKFITNGMLGKLTRWLRMLGHDAKYSRSRDDKRLIERAKAENRTLLTRDLRLYQQAVAQGTNAFFIEGNTEAEKLAQLSRRFDFKLEIDMNVSRCPKCNTRIRTVAKENVADRIPKATALYYNDFWKCLGCKQIYWRGAHWKRIQRTLREAKVAAIKKQ